MHLLFQMAIVSMRGASTRFLGSGTGWFGGAVYISYNFRAVGWLGGWLVTGVGVGVILNTKWLSIDILLLYRTSSSLFVLSGFCGITKRFWAALHSEIRLIFVVWWCVVVFGYMVTTCWSITPICVSGTSSTRFSCIILSYIHSL